MYKRWLRKVELTLQEEIGKIERRQKMNQTIGCFRIDSDIIRVTGGT